MTILLTGASGFLGQHFLAELDANHAVTTLGRTKTGWPHIHCDLVREEPRLSPHSFSCVIHAAGKAHATPRTRAEHDAYTHLNVQGTHRLLTALDKQPVLPVSFVYISTVLVYGYSVGKMLDERTVLGASDPYGKSKSQAEELLRAWASQTGVRLTILRLPLVAASQPVGNLAALATAIRRGYYVRFSDGTNRRSMVRADDVAAILLRAARIGGTYNLTDGYHPSLRELENTLSRWANRPVRWAIRPDTARLLARLGDRLNGLLAGRFPFNSAALTKLTSSLTFSDEAARRELGWQPRPVLDLFA